MTTADRNREVFLTSFAEFAAGNHDVLHRVLREDFVEHSPGTPSGRDAWIEFIKSGPAAEFDLKRVIADDNYVVAHYRLVPAGSEGGVAVVDIWRFEDGMIVEHWDVVQPVPDESDTPNGMF